MKLRVRFGMLALCVFLLAGCQSKNVDVVKDTSEAWQNVEQNEAVQEKEDEKESDDKKQDDGGNQEQEMDRKPVAEETKPNLPTPNSGLYPEMVAEEVETIPLEEGEKVAYITFDDGPCKTTPQLLEVLKRLDVKATFFVTAQYGTDEEVVGWMKMIHEAGHEIGVHSYSHRYNEIYSSLKNYLKDYKKMDDLIVKATGEHAKIFRFPGGSNTGYNASIRAEIIKEMTSRGLVYYDWNAYNGDCDGFNKSQMIEKAVTEAGYKNKSIVLMHNIPKKDTVIEALPSIVNQLRAKGYEFRSIDKTVAPIQFAKIDSE